MVQQQKHDLREMALKSIRGDSSEVANMSPRKLNNKLHSTNVSDCQISEIDFSKSDNTSECVDLIPKDPSVN